MNSNLLLTMLSAGRIKTNNKIWIFFLVSKPLYVALAQRKEDRKAHLAQQYVQRVSGMRMQQGQFGQVC